jgi:hypothetical protein
MWWARLLNVISGLLGVGAAPAAATAYESIATATGTGSSGVITFSSIPSTFKHLQLRITARSSGGNTEIAFTCNGDTGSNYSYHFVYGDGSAVAASASSSVASMKVAYGSASTALASTNAVNIVDLLDYQDTNKYKTIRSLSGLDVNGSGGFAQLSSGSWRSTAAVSTLTLTLANNYTTATQIALYGIKG